MNLSWLDWKRWYWSCLIKMVYELTGNDSASHGVMRIHAAGEGMPLLSTMNSI
jgi:hypothetical protein